MIGLFNLPIRLKGNLKHISGNLLSLLGAQNKYIGSASQALLTGVSLRCGIGTDFLLLPPYPGLSKVSGCRRKSPPTWLVLVGYSGWHFFAYSVFQKNIPGLAAFFDMSAIYFKPFWQPCISGKASKHPQYQPVTEVNAVCNPNYFLQVVFQVEIGYTNQASKLTVTHWRLQGKIYKINPLEQV